MKIFSAVGTVVQIAVQSVACWNAGVLQNGF